MKTVIICISDPYMTRGRQLREYYQKRRDEALILTPDFSHRKKQRITEAEEAVILIPHLAYRKNLSISRMLGHYLFSRKCLRVLEDLQPERIHCLIPANSLAAAMKQYKRKHPAVELIFDVQDLWPESFPVPFLRHIPGYGIWKRMRTDSIDAADHIVAECEFYRSKIGSRNPGRITTLFWSQKDWPADRTPCLDRDEIHLAYLGSMNHILDIASISALLQHLSAHKKTVLHLIGRGEKKDELVQELAGIDNLILRDHGEIYDRQKKQQIFNHCRFGINLMKSHIQVGLSMKSIDYLQSGLPVINSLSGDLHTLIEQENAGFNLPADPDRKIPETARHILAQSEDEHMKMRKNARKLYERHFSAEAFEETLDQMLDQGGSSAAGAEKPAFSLYNRENKSRCNR